MSIIAEKNNEYISRQFRWISSVSGDSTALARLNERMTWFYGQAEGRELYQTMLDTQEAEVPKDSVRYHMPRYVADSGANKVLEVGCGNGRLYRQIREYGYAGKYTGIEVADYIIHGNQKRHPEAVWQGALAYDIPFPDASFDLCFSLYVLEHFVYPERALTEMLRILRPGGKLVLVFPDFSASGRLPSQLFGYSEGPAIQKIKKLHWIDALVSLYDSRVRLPKALRQASNRFGSFPVNTAPICLQYPGVMASDIDAVYIASKEEVHQWAVDNGCQVDYPCGTDGEFKSQAFLTIRKP